MFWPCSFFLLFATNSLLLESRAFSLKKTHYFSKVNIVPTQNSVSLNKICIVWIYSFYMATQTITHILNYRLKFWNEKRRKTVKLNESRHIPLPFCESIFSLVFIGLVNFYMMKVKKKEKKKTITKDRTVTVQFSCKCVFFSLHFRVGIFFHANPEYFPN